MTKEDVVKKIRRGPVSEGFILLNRNQRSPPEKINIYFFKLYHFL